MTTGMTLSVFGKHHDCPTPGKRLFIKPDGDWGKETIGKFSFLAGETRAFASLSDLATFIRSADHDVHLTNGICGHNRFIVTAYKPNEELDPPVICRNNNTFAHPKGEGLLVVDSDNLRLLPVPVHDALVAAVPALASYARLEASSTGANISAPMLGELRGLTGQHTFFHVADATDIPRAIKVLHKRTILAGFGMHQLDKTGGFLERSPVDRQMVVPVQPIYLYAKCEGGVVQSKEVTLFDGVEVLDTRATIHDLTEAEEGTYNNLIKAARAALLSDGKVVRAKYVGDRVEELALMGMTKDDAEVVVHNALTKSISRLAPQWPITTSKGIVTVEQIIREGADVWHGETCRDPLEPDYGSDTVAKIFFNDNSIIINSFAHSSPDKPRKFILDRDIVAALDMMNDTSQLSPGIDLAAAETDAAIFQKLSQATQDSVAEAFALKYNSKLLYDNERGIWYYYDNTRWVRDDLGRVSYLVRQFCRMVGGSKSKELKFVNAVESFAKRDPNFSISSSKVFDRNNYLLNTPTGIVDLRTGALLEHDPKLVVSRMTRVSPQTTGGERFLQFLEEITRGDKELIRFHQMSLGSCLSGAIEAHWMLFWIGSGRNGKNTLGDVVMWVMGEYAKKVAGEVLMSKNGHESHPTELANLSGCRLAVSSEIEEGAFWHESRVNELTGDAMISARFMRQDFFEFARTHKHLIFGNNRPRLKTVSEALKARIKIVPFKASFIGKEDPELPMKLQGEAGFILQWLIEGHTMWVAAGRRLPNCAAVKRESDDYFSAQSVVDMWIRERLEVIENDHRSGREMDTGSTLYEDYRRWKVGRGEQPLSMTVWGETMGGCFHKFAAGSAIRYRGCRLLPVGAFDVGSDVQKGMADLARMLGVGVESLQ